VEQERIGLADQPERRELTSWKEIAHYLGVNVRTAQKWERDRGLPVRRRAGPRGRISADTASVNAWREQRMQTGIREDRICWPLGPALTVEVRFVGSSLKPAHIGLLVEYLNVLTTALFPDTVGTKATTSSRPTLKPAL